MTNISPVQANIVQDKIKQARKKLFKAVVIGRGIIPKRKRNFLVFL